MGLIERYSLRVSDCELWRRFDQALVESANYILGEAASTANHANRVIWANQTLADPAGMVARMKTRILGNPTLRTSGEAVTDSDIEYIVATLVDEFATGG